MVCVHGAVISSRYFRRLALELQPSRHVLAPDLPGYGLTDGPSKPLSVAQLASVLVEWAAAAGIESAVWIGNSLGCQIVASLAVARPSLAKAVVLVGPTVEPGRRSALSVLARLAMDAPMERPSLIAQWIRDLFACGLRRAVATIRVALDDRIEDRLPLLSAPTLVIRGARDALVSAGWARKVALIAGSSSGSAELASSVEVRGAAHGAHHSHAAEIARVITSFLARPSTSGSKP